MLWFAGQKSGAFSKKFNVRMLVDKNTARIASIPDDVKMAHKEVCPKLEVLRNDLFWLIIFFR